MKTDTSDILNDMLDHTPVEGLWDIKVVRADGAIEQRTLKNVVTNRGLNRIANRALFGTATPFYVIGVGTQTAAHSLGTVQAGLGEVLRKTGTANQSREWLALQCTIGGAADGVTGVALDTCFIADFPNSHASTGIIGNALNGLAVTLAGSDLLDLTVRIRIGSHDLAHTT